MRVMIYKRTHIGDPRDGCFGVHDCMGKIRNYEFDAVIGVGGIGAEARSFGIAGKINWIGIEPTKVSVKNKRGPVIMFNHFVDYGDQGPVLQDLAPALADRLYTMKARFILRRFGEQERAQALRILQLAASAPASPGFGIRKKDKLKTAKKCLCR